MAVVVYALALWLGLYLLRLDSRDAGAGLVAYALGLALGGGPATWPLTVLVPGACWLWALGRFYRQREALRGRARWVLVVASVFLALSLGALALPWLPRDVALLAVGVDLLLVGYAVATLDATDTGQVFLPAALRSLLTAGLAATVFGAQVGFAIAIEGASPTLMALLASVVGVSIALVVYGPALGALLDRALFPGAMGKTLVTLRNTGETLPRAANPATADLLALDEATFAKHTRRALSDLNRPDKLAASPLTALPALTAESPLERAAELRALLVERVEQLRPGDGYGLTDDWRYYNALYYPYVLGVRPYSRRYTPAEDAEDVQAVLGWFREQVPERTLYNWQTAAAALIAQDLRQTTTLGEVPWRERW